MALSTDKQIIIGVVVLAGLGGLVYRQMKEDAKKGSPTAAAQELPSLSAPEDVDKISITNGDKPEIVLEKKGDKWMLTKPVEALANQQSVKSLVENLKELKAKEVIASTADDELKKSYELDKSKAVHLVVWKGADKKADEWFGKSGGRGQMVMVEGKPAIYAGSGYSSYLYTRDVKGWRDTEIFRFDDAAASQVTIENKTSGPFSFTKGEKWAGTVKGKPIDRLDEDRVKDMVRSIHGLGADDFADGKTPADTGLVTPEATATVTLKDNAGKYVLKLGGISSGTSRYAMKEGSDTIYIVSSYVADWLTADTSKFQKAPDAGAPKDGGAAKGMPSMTMPGMPGMPGMPAGHPDMH